MFFPMRDIDRRESAGGRLEQIPIVANTAMQMRKAETALGKLRRASLAVTQLTCCIVAACSDDGEWDGFGRGFRWNPCVCYDWRID